MMFGFNVKKTRKDFDVLSSGVIYFDSACMSLKPRQVIGKMNEYYEKYPACGGRSGHHLSKKVEDEVDLARREVARLLNAKIDEVIFTRNATESINLIANALEWKEGDEIIVSDKEHNSNLIPWLKLKKKGVKVRVCKSNEDNTFNLENFENCFGEKTKLVAIVHVSNLDGVENPIGEIVKIAHKNKSLVLVDGAQSFPHKEIDVKKLGVDFFVLSGHKALGPTGIGVLYGRRDLLEDMEQFIVGGQTVIDSSYEGYEIEKLPNKFEAGLQDYAGIVGFGEACRYLRKVGLKNIEKHLNKLNKIVTEHLGEEKKIEIIGPKEAEKRSGIFTFNVKGMKAHDVAKMLDASKKIALRSGAFCVHSWFNDRKIEGAVRVSFYLYNTEEEVRTFVESVKKIILLV
ncbi:MAG: cysteine desulfurase [Nanoarchaeota archaeon]|nr:cysteine desulfurase [Nanoarchaeota archaeon]MBU1051569.1 cysteine desulfurase [Nanoarchaeota archaeon]